MSKLLTALFLLTVCCSIVASDFEPTETRMPTSLLVAPELLQGEHYRIEDTVLVQDVTNVYTINTTFGTFTAAGDYKLRARLHEIETIAALRAIDKAALSAQSATEVVKKPVEAVVQVVEKPTETIKGVPKGVSRWLKRTKRRVTDGYESAKEFVEEQNEKSDAGDTSDTSDTSAAETADKVVDASKSWAKRFFGLDRAYRQLAKQYKVDPYSDNEVLRAELKSVSKYSAASSFVTGRMMPSLPDEVGMLLDVGDLVWDLDPLDLQIQNEEAWRRMGANEQLIEALFENRNYSPTEHTRMVVALQSLKDVGDRPVMAQYAIEAESKDEARFIVRMAEFFALYAAKREPLVKLVATERLPLAITQKGNAVNFAPVDQVRWSKLVAEAATALTAIAKEVSQSSDNELWVQGRVSEIASSALREAGWKIIPHALKALG